VRQESANAAPSPELVQGHAAGLLACLEGMSHEVLSLLAGLREEIHSVERRVAESETTDPVTGLMNRREMERQLAARRASGEPLTLLLFELRGDVTDEVAQQVATRLYSHFRPSDVIARWAPEEFLVLFLGPPEVAQTRTKQVVAWLTGKYPVANGELTEIQVSGHMLESAAASD
jgi:GGDEF domain-containing protein